MSYNWEAINGYGDMKKPVLSLKTNDFFCVINEFYDETYDYDLMSEKCDLSSDPPLTGCGYITIDDAIEAAEENIESLVKFFKCVTNNA